MQWYWNDFGHVIAETREDAKEWLRRYPDRRVWLDYRDGSEHRELTRDLLDEIEEDGPRSDNG